MLDHLELGNLDARRDWGYAPEYVDAMWRMLSHDVPDDYVIASGTTYTVREFLDMAFDAVGLDYRDWVRVNTAYYRPDETIPLTGDSNKAKRVLGWEAQKPLIDIVKEMVVADVQQLGGKM